MKKNRSMRLAAVLLIIAILTTSIMSGTFAKYVTGDSANDAARVAQFGVAIGMNGNLYGDEYAAVGSGNTIIAYSGDDNTGTVQANAEGTNVVAPGTKSASGFGFTISGTPEVDVALAAEIETTNIFLKAGTYSIMVLAEGVTTDNFSSGIYYTEEDGVYTEATAFDAGDVYYIATEKETFTDYYPVVYTMGGDTTYSAGTTAADSLSALAAIIAEQLNGSAVTPTVADAVSTFEITSAIYGANTNLATALSLENSVIGWAWDFDDDTDGTYDVQDTILGDLQAGGTKFVKLAADDTYAALEDLVDYNLTTSFKISISVTQID